MKTQRFKTCLISAPRDADTTPLRDALSEHGVTVWDDDVLLVGKYWQQARETAIADVDFVCVVIPSSPTDPNVLLDLGVAIGAGRPLLLFVAPKVDLPAAVRGHAYARASLNDAEALRFHLDAFLKNAGKPERLHRNGQRREPTTPNPNVLKAALDQLSAWEAQSLPPSERDVVALLSELFQALNWEVSTASTPSRPNGLNGTRADLAVWVDELQTYAGNPLLIEVNCRSTVLTDAVHQFQRTLQERGNPLGLLVCWSTGGTSYVPGDWQLPVVVMSVRELIEAIGRGDFAQTLLSRRNSAVHTAA